MQLRVRELGGSLVSLGCNYCLYNPRNAGICAFTSRDIERGEVVVEYDGERVEMEEAARRGTPRKGGPALLWLSRGQGSK